MADHFSSKQTPPPDVHNRRLARLATSLARLGLPGAVLAMLVLRAEALMPLAVLQLKSIKLFPVLLVCCAEASWWFGGTVGLLLAAQWLLHEVAHMHAAQKIGLQPGWRSFLPFVGVYAGTNPTSFGSRENEAGVALAGILAGLTAATALHGLGQMLENPAVLLAARLGFLLNLINLLPFRPFDGGRIFPGYLWRYAADTTDDQNGDAASRRFMAGCHRIVGLFTPAANRPKDNQVVLAEAVNLVIVAAVGGLVLARMLLPPLAFSVGLLLVLACLWIFIGALITLDPRIVLSTAANRLAPRRAMPSAEVQPMALPWQDRKSAVAALAIYLVAVGACIFGASAG